MFCMMFCPNCGAQLNDGVANCPNCGMVMNNTAYNPAAQPVGYNNGYVMNQPPIMQLNTSRGLAKYILLSLITFGIYGLVCMSGISSDINTIASRYDGKRTMHFCLLAFIVTPLTLGIGAIVWYHNISARIGNELRRRGIAYGFDAASFWLWNVLGSLIIIGPFVYCHKMFKAMNLLAENYNVYG